MKVTFLTNYINHHQIPLADAMHTMLCEDYHLIQMQPMDPERIAMGWQMACQERPYVLTWDEDPQACQEIMGGSDVIIYGGAEREDILAPYLRSGKRIYRYSERIYKQGQWRAISPRGLLQKYRDHLRYSSEDIWLLCAGAYVASDFGLIGAYRKRRLVFGYFPKVEHENVEEILARKRESKTLQIIWAGRMISWKHPEVAIELLERLVNKQVGVHLHMIGDGVLRSSLEEMAAAKGMQEHVTFHGYLTPDEVREKMRTAHVHLFTSDREEGWGAVLNESMNSLCVPVACAMIGAAPYLIAHGENGYLYDVAELALAETYLYALAIDPVRREEMAKNAYHTITTNWTAEVAAQKLLAHASRGLLAKEAVNESDLHQKDDSYVNHGLHQKEESPVAGKSPTQVLTSAPQIRPGKRAARRIAKKMEEARKGSVARAYVCHTYYHVYVSVMKELALYASDSAGEADIYLSNMSTAFGDLGRRLMESGIFRQVHVLDEKRDTSLPELMRYRRNKGNVVVHLWNRILFTKKYAKAQEPYLGKVAMFRQYRDLYVYCDSDPIGYYLNAQKIPYHAVEDGYNCLRELDDAHVANRGHFALKKWMSKHNLIFIMNGYGKYCLDMEVNDLQYVIQDGPVYKELPRKDLERALTSKDRQTMLKIFLPDYEAVKKQLDSSAMQESATQESAMQGSATPDSATQEEFAMFLTEAWPGNDLEARAQIARDIVRDYCKGYRVIIKPHPRDELDYAQIIPGAVVIPGKFPVEVLNMVEGISIKRAVSIITSAMDNVDFVQEKINLGASFWDAYEDPSLHQFNKAIK